ncbi:MAG: ferritin [Alphaproteobacteria bacterium]|nr:ferritin [Alphaproteobacteria bacterium]
MSSETLHAPRDRLSRETIDAHQAIVSLMEELDAVDWYQQRADDCDDPALKEILLHNMREEVEHAAMLLEWLRRHSAVFDRELRARLFTDDPIAADGEEGPAPALSRPAAPRGFTIGTMKEAP